MPEISDIKVLNKCCDFNQVYTLWTHVDINQQENSLKINQLQNEWWRDNDTIKKAHSPVCLSSFNIGAQSNQSWILLLGLAWQQQQNSYADHNQLLWINYNDQHCLIMMKCRGLNEFSNT